MRNENAFSTPFVIQFTVISVNLKCFVAPKLSREELMVKTITEISQKLVEAHDNGSDVDLNK